jgi:threonyl-tRNA synthetase
MRVRAFTQDDGHIFCTEDQIQSEVTAFNDLLRKVYADFGFHDVAVKLALRPDGRVGEDHLWDKAESSLRAALTASGLTWDELPGEGAFYGPKIEFHIKDAIGRSWQCGTVQVDFSMPGRLGAEYVGEDNSRHTPVMLHRAILGSLERFIGILVENHAGAFPLWLAPVQVVVMNISEAQTDYAEDVAKMLREAGLRVESDLRGEKINYKIREHSLLKRPYIVVVGDKEKAAGLVALRARGNQDLGQMSPQALIERLLHEQCSRSASV